MNVDLSEHDEFKFNCTRCGKCCYLDVDLSPFDVFRIAKHLKCTTTEFAENHCIPAIHEDIHTPFARLLKKGSGACKFLRVSNGVYNCIIENQKPTACKLYPLGRGFDETLDEKIYPYGQFFFLQKINCSGKGELLSKASDWFPNTGVQYEFDLKLSELMVKLSLLPRKHFDDEMVFKIYSFMYFEYSLNNDEDFLSEFILRRSLIYKLVSPFNI